MKAFNSWWDNDITKEYPLYQDKDGYNIGNTRALRVGWKAALEYIRSCSIGGLISVNEIDEELKEE